MTEKPDSPWDAADAPSGAATLLDPPETDDHRALIVWFCR